MRGLIRDPNRETIQTRIAVAVLSFTALAAGEQVHTLDHPKDVTAPAPGVVMQPEYAAAVTRMAYIWGPPMVNQVNRRATIT
ncbi:MAG: hypothetical protein R3F30_12215 [Planctomycetota bacterium]